MPVPALRPIEANFVVLRIVLPGQSGIFHISCYANDSEHLLAQREIGLKGGILQMLADRILIWKQSGSQELAQNDRVTAAAPVALIERAACHNRNVQNSKIVRRNLTNYYRSTRAVRGSCFTIGKNLRVATLITPSVHIERHGFTYRHIRHTRRSS